MNSLFPASFSFQPRSETQVMAVVDKEKWNCTVDDKDTDNVVQSTAAPIDPSVGSIPCDDTWFFLAIYGPVSYTHLTLPTKRIV